MTADLLTKPLQGNKFILNLQDDVLRPRATSATMIPRSVRE